MLTKREFYNKVIETVKDQELVDFAISALKTIDYNMYRARQIRAHEAAAADELTDKISLIVDNNYWTVNEIRIALMDPQATNAKIAYRCNALVEDGIFEKSDKKIGHSYYVTYRRIDNEVQYIL